MRPPPERMPDVDRRFVTRVPPDPYVRVDTCDYSLDPRLVGRRVELRVSQREVLAVCLDTGELACRHTRSFARHRTITVPERARAEEWSYERFTEALLQTEVASRDAHGGEARIKQARFPARKTLEEFDFSFQRSVQKTLVLHLGQLDFLPAKENVLLLGPPGKAKTHLAIALSIRASLAGHRVLFATAAEWVTPLVDAQRQATLEEELRRVLRVP